MMGRRGLTITIESKNVIDSNNILNLKRGYDKFILSPSTPETFCINYNNCNDELNINNIIKKKFYDILIEYKYISLGKYFILRNLILGSRK